MGFDIAIVDLHSADQTEGQKTWLTANFPDVDAFIPLFTNEELQHRFADTTDLHDAKGQHVHFIHYPGVSSRVLSMYDTAVSHFMRWELFYATCTEKGSSGAPGLAPNGALIAIHRRASSHIASASDDSHVDGTTAQFNCGLRIDLFLRDALQFSRFKSPRSRANKMHATVSQMLERLKSSYGIAAPQWKGDTQLIAER